MAIWRYSEETGFRATAPRALEPRHHLLPQLVLDGREARQ